MQIPKEYHDLPVFKDRESKIIESSEDIKQLLAHAYKLGLRPVTTAQGELFTKNNEDMRIRLAAVDRKTESLKDVANTIKGVLGRVAGLDMQALDVQHFTIDELKEKFPPTQTALKRLTDPEENAIKRAEKLASIRAAAVERGSLLPESATITKKDNNYTINFPIDASAEQRKNRALEMVVLLRDEFQVQSDREVVSDIAEYKARKVIVGQMNGNVTVSFPPNATIPDYQEDFRKLLDETIAKQPKSLAV